MIKAELPSDEPARLQTLRSLHILDTLPEERFDRVTRMAKRLFGVPIALVSLIDMNRQWFKSAVGIDVTETSRDVSFCAHAILGKSVLVIPDATKDIRFADNPLVTGEPHIRFYAGCPIESPDGHKIGTLCVIDRQPRSFAGEDIEALADLTHIIERELAVVQMATIDELTHISNRRGFMLLAEHSLRLCERQSIPAALVFLDLDKFKPINDAFGHAEGDRVLKYFATQMMQTSREADVNARIGGDEFAMLLINTNNDLAEARVARLRMAVEQHNQESRRGYGVAFSHGIVAFDPGKHENMEAILADGDALMYQVKKTK
ncbi:MAG: sensor domain-containing diguanylate cyclase [Pseudomonadota bacterium]